MVQISLGGWENFLINIFGVCAPASPPQKKNCLWWIALSVLTQSMVTSIGRGITHWYYSSNTIMHIGHCRTISESATFFSLSVDLFKMAADDNVQDKTKIMESADDKKHEEIVLLTLESILCGLNLNVNFVLLCLLL